MITLINSTAFSFYRLVVFYRVLCKHKIYQWTEGHDLISSDPHFPSFDLIFPLYPQEDDLAELAKELHGGYYTGIIAVRAVTFAVAVIGITGNVFAYLTASRLDSKTSGTTYIKCLAVADTAAVFQVSSIFTKT